MDLPTELRVKIAKYALHHDGGLNWYWKLKKNGDPETYVGSFRLSNKSESINPLGETCTQLYEETSAIPFKVNILIFGPYFMNRRVDPLEGWRAAFDAYNHFLTKSPRSISAVSKSVHFDYHFGQLARRTTLVNGIFEAAKKSPHLSLRVNDLNWTVMIHQGDEERCVKRFVDRGKEYENILSTAPFTTETRTWRVFPQLSGAHKWDALRTYLAPADFEIACAWYNNGI